MKSKIASLVLACVAASAALPGCSGSSNRSSQQVLTDSIDSLNLRNERLREQIALSRRDSVNMLNMLRQIDNLLVNISYTADSAQSSLNELSLIIERDSRFSTNKEMIRQLSNATGAVAEIRYMLGSE